MRSRPLCSALLPAAWIVLAVASIARADGPQWVWSEHEAKDGQTVWFRRIFEISGPVKEASFTGTCDNRMKVFVNGRAVVRSDAWETPVHANIAKALRDGPNLIAIEASNEGSVAGLIGEVAVKLESGDEVVVPTDGSWQATEELTERWKELDFEPEAWGKARVIGPLGSAPWSSEVTEVTFRGASEGRPAPRATPAESLKLLPGFRAELLYSVPKEEQGSWVSLCIDDKGRIIASDQYGSLYRFTPPPAGEVLEGDDIERIELDIGGAHGLLWAFDSLYVVRGEGRQGLYRVLDTDGDDKLDEVRLLRRIPGGGEHGPHSIVLAPDGESLYVCAGNHTDLPNPERSVVPREWDEDLILPRQWDAGGHAVGRLAPGGWIARIDPDGKTWEIVSVGYRNEFDIAFNADGELFAFDADMEWDIGLPWYRPTRVCHATSGSEFGWRSGTGKWPEYYPDSLASVVDVGPGSPTGIAFGYGLAFPPKYQRALFISDWSYGKLYAVHLEPDGSSYRGTLEQFVSGTPLPLTDVVARQQDGALYFAIGGRRTQSGLYRITHADAPKAEKAENIAATPSPERELRHRLERFHRDPSPQAIDAAWPHLAHADRAIRFAARVAIEHQPVDSWRKRALDERRPVAAIEAIIALARHGSKDDFSPAVGTLDRIDYEKLDESRKLALLRAYELVLIRLGPGDATTRGQILSRLDPHYPAPSYPLNRELSQILIHLEAPGVVARTLTLRDAAPTQEEQIHYALALRTLASGWTLPERRRYFEWFSGARGYRGGHSFGGFLRNIRNEAIEKLSDDEKKELADVLSDAPPAGELAELPQPKGPGKEWTTDELLTLVDSELHGRSYENGKAMFAAARCFSCHRFAGRGGAAAPDLTGVSGRFSHRDLLESIIEPSKTISDQYQATVFVLRNGDVVSGRIVNLAGDSWMVNTDMLDPNQQVRVGERQVVQTLPAETSMMPAGLLNPLNRDEVLDLIAYLLAGGNEDDPAFRGR